MAEGPLTARSSSRAIIFFKVLQAKVLPSHFPLPFAWSERVNMLIHARMCFMQVFRSRRGGRYMLEFLNFSCSKARVYTDLSAPHLVSAPHLLLGPPSPRQACFWHPETRPGFTRPRVAPDGRDVFLGLFAVMPRGAGPRSGPFQPQGPAPWGLTRARAHGGKLKSPFRNWASKQRIFGTTIFVTWGF